MLVRLTLENFMAHGRTVLEFGPGVTALVGLNNTGKSAVVEALRCLATNPTPRHYIRHGAKVARVEALFDDGVRVTWIRREKSAGYELLGPGDSEPQAFWKLGKGGVPQEVQDVLRLGLVELDGYDAVDVHLGNQKKPIFLLDDQRLLAPFFAAQAESAHLLAMQKALKGRVQEAKSAKARAQANMAKMVSDLGSLSALPDLAMRTERLQGEYRRLAAMQDALPALESALRTIAQARDQALTLRKRLEGVGPLKPPPRITDVRPLARLVAECTEAAARCRVSGLRAAAVEQLVVPPQVFNTYGLSEWLARRAKVAVNRSKTSARLEALEKTPALPKIFDMSSLVRLLADGRLSAVRRDRSAKRAKVLGGVLPPPKLHELSPLAQLVRDIGRLQEKKLRLKDALKGKEAELAGFESQLADRLRRIGVCPTCRGSLNAATFMEHVHES